MPSFDARRFYEKETSHIQIRRLAFSGVFLALALALPFLTG